MLILRAKKVLKRWLPGIISGGADNDPAGISTYSISGAQFGYQQLWLLVLSTPMLIAVQAMCARLGDVKRKGLMAIIKEHYSPYVVSIALLILVITNTATLGADLAAMAEALGLITQTSLLWWIVPIAVITWYIIVFKNYKIIEKYLFFLTLIFLSYVASGLLANPNWFEVIRSIFLPRFNLTSEYFMAALALLGTTITPFLFFWQSKQEVEEHKSRAELNLDAKKEDTQVAPGFIYSNIISLFIIVSTAAVLHNRGITQITTAADAARSLEPFAGPLAKYLFAFGIIGAGLLAVPILAASTAYVVAETFNLPDSLSDTIHNARGFYAAITLSILFGIGIAISGISPIIALFYSQVLNGMLVPFLLVLIMLMSNNKKIMGDKVNTWFDNLFGSLTIIVMIGATVGLFWQMVK